MTCARDNHSKFLYSTHARRRVHAGHFFFLTTDELTSQLNSREIVALSDRLGKPLVLKGRCFPFNPPPPKHTPELASILSRVGFTQHEGRKGAVDAVDWHNGHVYNLGFLGHQDEV